MTDSRGAPAPTLARRTVAAAQWRFGSSVVQGLLQFAVGVLLARILSPDDFGLVALAWILIGLATLVADLGLGAAVVQRPDLTDRHLRVAFTASLGTGALLAGLLVALAPVVGALTREAELPAVLRLLALMFVLGGAGVTARSMLKRALRFQPLFWTSFASYAVGYAGVATTLAVSGFGVWSLVWGALAQSAIDSAIAIAVVRPPARPLFARAEFRDLFRFGAGVSLNNVVNYLARNGDNFIVGRWLGSGALGLYSRAYNLMLLPLTYLGGVSHHVLFPAMAEIQTDSRRMGRGYLMAVQMITLIAAPVMAGMVVAAPHMVVTLYGEAWLGMVPVLQVLCVAGLFRAVYHLAGTITFATGRVGAELKRQMVYAALVAAGGLAGSRWGILGVAVGVAAAIFYMYLAMSSLALRLVDRTWGEFLAAQAPGLLLGAQVGVVALAARIGLERAGAPSELIFLATLLASGVGLLAGLYLLPERVRPTPLFTRLGAALERFPAPLASLLHRLLRIPWGTVAP